MLRYLGTALLAALAVQSPAVAGESGPWVLQPRHTHGNTCLQVRGGDDRPGAQIEQAVCDLHHLTKNQMWTFIDAGHGYYWIRNNNSEMCLNVHRASDGDGVRLIQYGCGVYRENDKFLPKYHTTEEGGQLDLDFYYLEAKHSGKCIRVQSASRSGGAPIVQGRCGAGDHDKFTWSLVTW